MKHLTRHQLTRYRHRIFFTALFILPSLITLSYLTLRQAHPTQAGWWNDSWQYRKHITIQSNQVSGTTNLSNFPVLINVTDSDFASYAQANGNDFVFTDSQGVKLDHQIETYNGGTGALIAWVRVPTLLATENTQLFVYYGNSSSLNQEQPDGVWDENFKGVWHLNQTPDTDSGTKEVLDSTGYANHANSISMDNTNQTPVQVNGGLSFSDTQDEYLEGGNSESLQISGDTTISFWADIVSASFNPVITYQDYDTGAETLAGNLLFHIHLTSTNYVRMAWEYGNGTNADALSTATLTDATTLTQITVVRNASTNQVTFYQNGTQLGNAVSYANNAAGGTNATLTIGEFASNGLDMFNGTLDEIRVSNTVRTSYWIATEYNNQSSPSTFYEFGAQETSSGPIAFWKFDEGTDNSCPGGTNDVCDSSSNGNDGAITGATWQTDNMCVSGKCLFFDGTDDTVSVSSTVSGIKTVSFWVKVSSTSTTQELLDLNGTDYLTSVSGTVTAAGFGTETVYVDGQPATALTANRWHHVVVTTSSSLSGSAITLAQVSTDYGHIFLDEIKLYPNARSADQVKADYNQYANYLGVQKQDWLSNGLVGYWKMDETSGTTVADASGNGNTGTLTNAQETGTSDASGNTTTTLIDSDSAVLSATDDDYNGMILRFTAACGSITSDTERVISDYIGATKTITVSTALAQAPDNCAYEIRHQIGGKFGSGLGIEGGDGAQVDISSFPSNFFRNQSYTVSVWAKRLDTSTSHSLFSYRSDSYSPMGLAMRTNYIRFSGYNSANQTVFQIDSGTTSINTWYHIVGILDYENKVARVFLNGVQVGEQSCGSCLVDTTTQNLTFGKDYWNGSLYGVMDEARIYNRALSLQEVASLYNWAPGPIGHWNFDEGSGATAFDRSGNGFNATLSEIDWAAGKFGNALKSTNNNGIREYAYTADHDELDFSDSQDFTYSAWVKPGIGETNYNRFMNKASNDAPYRGYYIYGYGNTYRLYCTYRYDVDFDTAVAQLTAETYFDWHHVSCLMDRNGGITGTPGIYIYVDGVLMGSDTTLTAADASNHTTGLMFGEHGDTAEADNWIDEAKIYNYARTQEQILQDMHTSSQSVLGSSTPGGIPEPIIHWQFDEMAGISAHNTVRPSYSTGTVTNALWQPATNCKRNGCLAFDGSGDMVYLSYDTNPKQEDDVDFDHEPFSGSAWVYVTTMPGSGEQAAIIAKFTETGQSRAYRLYVDNDDADTTGHLEVELYDELNDQTITASQPADSIQPSTWYHVGFTYNGRLGGTAGDLKLYVNGQYASQNTANVSFGYVHNVAADFTVGEYDSSDVVATHTGFTGRIDEVKIFANALTADQIKLDANAGTAANFGIGAASEASNLSDGAGNPPIAYWNMDENTGTSIRDTSGNGYHSTAINNVSYDDTDGWRRGHYGSSFLLDGINDNVQFANSAFNLSEGNFTLEAWVKPTAFSTNYERLFTNRIDASNGYHLAIVRSNDATCPSTFLLEVVRSTTYYAAGCDSTSQKLSPGKWYHVAATFDAATNTPTVYTNGILQPGTAAKSLGLGVTNTLTLGSSSTVGSNVFNGAFDEVKVYNYVRTPAQIAYNYNRGLPIAHWRFDECQGTTIYNSASHPEINSGSTINGTLNLGAIDVTSAGTCQTASTAWGNGASGKYSASMSFDGSDDYILIPDHPRLEFPNGSDFTISLWLKQASLSINTLVAKKAAITPTNSGYLLRTSASSGSVVFYAADGTNQYQLDASTNVTDDTWHHIIIVYDDDSTTDTAVYIDGVKDTTTPTGTLSAIGDVGVNTRNLVLGAESDFQNVFDGQIDDVRIYNYALSLSQVKNVMNDAQSVRFGPSESTPE